MKQKTSESEWMGCGRIGAVEVNVSHDTQVRIYARDDNGNLQVRAEIWRDRVSEGRAPDDSGQETK